MDDYPYGDIDHSFDEWAHETRVHVIKGAATYFANIQTLIEIQEDIEQKEAQLKLLEKASGLEKRLRKYKESDPVETWASRWIASPVAYLFPADRREEWLGDLYEVNREMLHKDYPRWLVNVINIGRTIIFALSALQIKITDFLLPGQRKSD